MKVSVDLLPLVESLQTSNSEVVREHVDIIAEEYPNLRAQREAHLELYRRVHEFDPKIASLNTAPALELMERTIEDAIAARPDTSDLRLRESLNSAYEYMAFRTSQLGGLMAADEMLEIAKVSKALAKANIIWAHLQKAEAELIAADNPVRAIEELEAAREHVRGIVGSEHKLYQAISQTLDELIQ